MNSIDASNASLAARAHSSGFGPALRGMPVYDVPCSRNYLAVGNPAITVHIFVGFEGFAHILFCRLQTVAQHKAQHRLRRAAGEMGKLLDATPLRWRKV
jgi:hypothetical protein